MDPFAGSGTVPVVCKKKKRRCIAVDIEEEDVKMTQGRLMELSEMEEFFFKPVDIEAIHLEPLG